MKKSTRSVMTILEIENFVEGLSSAGFDGTTTSLVMKHGLHETWAVLFLTASPGSKKLASGTEPNSLMTKNELPLSALG
jgi:hypothetical protein